jgi:hypothetical protein
MAKRSIRKLRHRFGFLAHGRSKSFTKAALRRAWALVDREGDKAEGAAMRALPGGRDERKAAAVAKQKAMETNP